MAQEVLNQRLIMDTVHLQRLRAGMLVDLNRCYPRLLDTESLLALDSERDHRSILRELCYLRELGLVSRKKNQRWRITASGRDFLLGLVKADGIMSPNLLDSIGED